MNVKIDDGLVRRLVASQIPQWKNLPVKPVAQSGWDNRTFHLGDTMLVRLPSAVEYGAQVEKEQRWLPLLAPLLPLTIPTPLVMGEPSKEFPWSWSVYRWIEGTSAASSQIPDPREFAQALAAFLLALQGIDTTNGPLSGPQSFYRGGALAQYDSQVRQAIAILGDKIAADTAMQVWQSALAKTWQNPPVWVHGDISAGNLLVQDGQLSAVIDFGQLAVGDPACDLAIAWTFFKGESREHFRSYLPYDTQTWDRARGWALWKALIVSAGFTNPNNYESIRSEQTIRELLADYQQTS